MPHIFFWKKQRPLAKKLQPKVFCIKRLCMIGNALGSEAPNLDRLVYFGNVTTSFQVEGSKSTWDLQLDRL